MPRSALIAVWALAAGGALLGPPPAGRSLAGRVCDSSGHGLSGAVVAVAPPSPGADEPTTRPLARTHSGENGAFLLEGLPSGPLVVTASHAGGTGAVAFLVGDDEREDVTLSLSANGALVTGRLRRLSGERPSPSEIRAHRYSDDKGVVFYATPDAQGRYALRLPPGTYFVLALAEGGVPQHREVAANRDQRVDFDVVARAPAPDPVLAWIRSTAVHLETTGPGGDPGDLEGIAAALHGVRILGLGEPTHGSQDPVRFLQRLMEQLPAEVGASLVMLEGSFSGGMTADAYVLGGETTAREAVHALRLRENEALFDLVEWMRERNGQPHRRPTLHLAGLDINPPAPAARQALDALERADPARAQGLRAELAELLDDRTQFDVATLDPAGQETIRQAAQALERALAQVASRPGSPDGTDWELMARLAANVARNVEMQRAPEPSQAVAIRDEAMADNALWLLERHGPDARGVILAHDTHVTLAPPRLGAVLRERMGDGYLALGSFFDHGSFLALEFAFGSVRDYRPQRFTVGPSPEGSLGSAFRRAGIPVAFVDLRRLPPGGPVAEWFSAPRQMWSIGAGFFPRFAPAFLKPVVAPEEFDALLFVEETTSYEAGSPP